LSVPPDSTLLALDCAGERCTLALRRGAHEWLAAGAPGQTHLEHVLPLVEQLFARAALRPADCDAFAFACGPGSFTGLRVACTVVQGLALGAERPVVPVGHLDVLVRAAGAPADPDGAAALALLDARMDQTYFAPYVRAAGHWRAAAPAQVGGRAELREALAQWRPAFCAGEGAWIGRYIGGGAVVREAKVEAGLVARMAQERLALGQGQAPELALPLYVRDRVAQTVAQRRAARAEPPA
jgi:tRNA threonylcarbamoyladenosine biosynthesis protein TsaB